MAAPFEEEELPTEDVLNSFRAEWKRELEGSQQRQTSDVNTEEKLEQDKHKKARELFQEGVNLEQNGNLYDAIRFYKKAVQLVPDIEKEVYQSTSVQVNPQKMNISAQVKNEDENHNAMEDSIQDNEDIDNLIERFNRDVCLDNKPVIQQEFENNNERHIGSLPAELLNLIFKWVVSADLDFRSLENCSLVCKGFYLAARDEEIWKQICKRAFGKSSLSHNTESIPWRQWYLSSATIHYNGCYVSKMTYIRQGERGFQDHESYRAWHMVTYYRLVRLFPGGKILMVLSADDPSLTAKLMNNSNFCSIQGALFGEYRVVEKKLVCVLHKTAPKRIAPKIARRKRRDSMIYCDVPDQDFLVEFQIKGKNSKKLYWSSYKIVNRYSTGRETEDEITLSDQNFPRMQFVKVSSYHFESSAPL